MIHCVAMQMGFEADVYFCNTMIEAYVKSGYSGTALKLFNEMPYRDLVSWTSMISGFAYGGNTNGAFGLFNEMRKEVEPNEVTMIVMLQRCSTMVEGRQLHGYVIRFGSLIDQSLKNSILKMYADFGSEDDSELLFEETARRDVVSWNIMTYLYSSKGKTMKMADCLSKMRHEVEPSIETLTVLIAGLGQCRYPSQGRQIHCLSLKTGLFDDILMTTLLKCMRSPGIWRTQVRRHCSARICFDRMLVKDLVTWSSMIEGLGTHGLGSEALEVFHQMKAEGIEPNSVTFLSLLSACSHSGLCCEALNS
ncbi:UNVERIFIED_CONTAM: Pentatricopeptide repeat-containing protein, chloroplastic [Sesamum radiatum]|uniref:Pentatricopeptide repeat-containing protein, chloroplastic n=1 Tax=Sesamum radiatum TaxID=300843 RepID=A0AAW2TJJ1_SESRA